MKIDSLVLENFRTHRSFALMPQKVTLVTGPNGSGKTSLRHALEWVLTGRCALTDGRGLGGNLATVGHATGTVSLESGDAVVCRSTDGTLSLSWLQAGQQDSQRELEANICCSADRARLSLSASRFFDLDAKEQAGLLSELLRLHPTQAIVQAELAKLEAQTSLPILEVAKAVLGVNLADMGRGKKLTYDERTICNRDLKESQARLTALEAAGQELVFVDAEESLLRHKALQEATKALQETQTTLAAAEHDQDRIGRLVAKLATAKQALADCEAGIAGAPAKNLDEAQAERDTIANALRDRRASLDQAHINLGQAETRLRHHLDAVNELACAEAELRRYQEAKRLQCPACGEQFADASLQASLLQATNRLEAARARPLLATPGETLQEAANQARIAVADLAKRIQVGEQRLRSADLLVAEAAKASAKLAQAEAKREAVAALQAELEQTPDSSATGLLGAEVASCKQRLDASTEAVAEATRWREHIERLDNAKGVVAKLTTRKQVLEELVPFFREDGLRARLLASGLEPFQNALNATLAAFGWSARHDAGLSLEVSTAGDWVPYKALSDGEQVVVALSHQAAFAKLTGLGVVVVDRLEALDDKRQAILLQACTSLDVDHVFLLGVRCIPTDLYQVRLDIGADLVAQLSGVAA